MNKAVVVSGEASETDSEDECKITPKDLDMTKSIQGTLLSGEGSESENESSASVGSAISALDQLECKEKKIDEKYNSLLHQKLRENNAQFHSDLDNLCQITIGEATKSLGMLDQHLIKSQVTLQNAVTSLKTLNTNSSLVKNKLHSMLSANFLPSVKINKQ